MNNIILLHGALGAKTQLDPLAKLLEKDFNCYTFNFEGHGDRYSDQEFSIDRFARNLADYLDTNNLSNVSIFSYSMGGYVALKLALLQPYRFKKIVTLGTKFNWSPEEAAKEVKMLNPEKIEEKVPAFADYLKSLHTAQSWKINMQKTAAMMLNLGNKPALDLEQLSRLNTKCFIGLGDRDEMVTREETQNVAQAIPGAEFYLLADAVHPIQKIDMVELAAQIRKFIL